MSDETSYEEKADIIEGMVRRYQAVETAARHLRVLFGPRATLSDHWYGEVCALDDALEALDAERDAANERLA